MFLGFVAPSGRAAHIPAMTRFLPILPLRDIVVFPHRIVPLFVGRDKSVAALESAIAEYSTRERRFGGLVAKTGS